MKTKLLTCCALLLLVTGLSAQNARSILDKANDTYNKSGAITASFTLDAKDPKTKRTSSYDGTVFMKGNKFKIDIPDATTWFDGTTQWVYIKDTEEVNITNPTGQELQAISPSVLFGIYKKGFNLAYKGQNIINGKNVSTVELTPQKKGGDFTKIIVDINQADNMFARISLTDKSGIQNILTIKSYKQQPTLNDSTFQFNKKEYPGAEVVDLR